MQDEAHTAPLYAARAVFPYLLVGNVRDANKAYRIFITRLDKANPNLAPQEVSGSTADLRIYPSLPLLNFLGCLLLTVQKGSAELFRQLKTKYAVHINETGNWDEALPSVGEMYFGIQRPRQGNPLFDMMGSMFGGGGAPAKPQPRRVGASAPVAEDID